jgi:hypothetical protein
MIQRKESYMLEKKYVFGAKICGLGGNGRNLLTKNKKKTKLYLSHFV